MIRAKGMAGLRRPGTAVVLRAAVVLFLLAGMALLAACVHDLNTEEKSEKAEYVICDENHLPEQLQALLAENKKKPATFTYSSTMYLYLVVCYGAKEYGGYSVRVEEMRRSGDTIYLRTQLQGPSSSEPVVRTETYPWIVLRCARTDAFCVIDP